MILPAEQGAYENSLKYYRDLNNVVDTSRQEGREEGREESREEGATRVIVRLLEKRFGQLSERNLTAIRTLSVEESETLVEAQIDFDNLSDFESWLDAR